MRPFHKAISAPILKELRVSHFKSGLAFDIIPNVVVGLPFHEINPVGFNNCNELYDVMPPVLPAKP